jgi:fructokinase
MDPTGMQQDGELPTGRVTFSLEGGEPDYRIDHPVAYDRIQPPAGLAPASLVYHGTLALRDALSRRALAVLLDSTSAPVFVDVNLRAPWWDRDVVLECVRRASWVKLNHEELDSLAGRMDPADFLERFDLDGLIITMGARGARCLTAAGVDVSVAPSATGELVDTVGAGDALASVMICGLLRGWVPGLALERAQAFASAICGQRGATVNDPDFYRHFLAQWAQE